MRSGVVNGVVESVVKNTTIWLTILNSSTMQLQSKNPHLSWINKGLSSVAGEGFEPTTFGL